MATAGIAASERVSRLRERMLGEPPAICTERGYWLTESYRETESDPPVIRKAKALDRILKNMTIAIQDDELIVGRATGKPRAAALVPEIRWRWLIKEIDTISTRHINPFVSFTEEEKAKIKEFLPYWEGRTLEDKCRALKVEDAWKLDYEVGPAGGPIGYPGHTAVGYEKLLTKGLNGVKEEVDRESGKLNLANTADLDKYQFLRAVNITLDAAKCFAERYADLARNMAEKETDSQRKAELERIAENCRRVPANPARNFYEAVQSVWLTHVVLLIEGWWGGSFGRVDQYLYPFYKKDIEEGRLTREKACELLSLLLIKTNELENVQPVEMAMMWAGYTFGASMTLGGLTRDGKDAVNELTYLFLDAEMDVRLIHDDFVIRIHKNNPDSYVMRACEVAKELKGKLKFVSDETNIQRLLKDGKTIGDARDYIVVGCWCITVPGRSFDFMGAGGANLPLMVELALNDGVSRLTGEQVGPRTGDPRKFSSYDEVWDAYRKQVEATLPISFAQSNANHQMMAQYCSIPFQSALFEGCIQKGLDILDGGTYPYLSGGSNLRGVTNVADSLAAVKKVVFEDRKISMERLIDALDKNFEGEDEVLRLLGKAPKFGNDDDYVDSIVDEVIIHAVSEAVKFRRFAGALTTGNIDAGPGAITQGRNIGALPDGRKASEAIAESGIGPYLGRDVNGPTVCMRSVVKVDHMNFTRGDVLNMKFSPDALKDESKMRKFASLIRTYCETGGGLIQFNIVDANTLRDAQKHPEKYRDLLVRVATYSAYFVDLPKEAQDNIIARTEFQEL